MNGRTCKSSSASYKKGLQTWWGECLSTALMRALTQQRHILAHFTKDLWRGLPCQAKREHDLGTPLSLLEASPVVEWTGRWKTPQHTSVPCQAAEATQEEATCLQKISDSHECPANWYSSRGASLSLNGFCFCFHWQIWIFQPSTGQTADSWDTCFSKTKQETHFTPIPAGNGWFWNA